MKKNEWGIIDILNIILQRRICFIIANKLKNFVFTVQYVQEVVSIFILILLIRKWKSLIRHAV